MAAEESIADEQKVRELTLELRSKDEAISQLKSDCSELETLRRENAELMKKAKLDEIRLKELEAQVSKQSKEADFLQGRIDALKTELRHKEEDARVEVMEEARRVMFRSEVGQSFLEDLANRVISAYKLSATYIVDLVPQINHYVVCGFRAAVSQATLQGFKGEFNEVESGSMVTVYPEFEGDTDMDSNHDWLADAVNQSVLDFCVPDNFAPEAILSISGDLRFDLTRPAQQTQDPVLVVLEGEEETPTHSPSSSQALLPDTGAIISPSASALEKTAELVPPISSVPAAQLDQSTEPRGDEDVRSGEESTRPEAQT